MPSDYTFDECYKHNPSKCIAYFQENMTTIETIVQLQLNTTSVSTSASETLISDFSNMDQTTMV